ncbi:hypothetical protein [Kibdelosporangium philippinense]
MTMHLAGHVEAVGDSADGSPWRAKANRVQPHPGGFHLGVPAV